MKRATPMEIGVAMMRAMAAAHTVPKTSGQTYTQKLDAPFGSVPGFATIAGMLCTTRKIATAASTARMIEPATMVLVEKTRSPSRFLAVISPAAVVIPVFPMRCAVGCHDDLGRAARATQTG